MNTPEFNCSIGKHDISNGLLPNQDEAKKKIVNEIESIRSKVSNQKPSKEWYQRVPVSQAFSILADRGEGKTVTLISVCSKLAQKKNKNDHPAYFVPPVVEPEIMKSGEDIFDVIVLNLLCAIRAQKDIAPNLEKKLAEFIENSASFTAEGKKLLTDLSGDLDGYANRLINRQAPYHQRALRFSAWIDEFVKDTDYKMLVIAIDDIDICRDRASEILYVIRAYLSHPRLVTIISADLPTMERALLNDYLKELPEALTAQAKLPESLNTLFTQEYEQEKEYVQQFLLKVLPPAYRVHLRGIEEDKRLYTFKDDTGKEYLLKRILREVALISDFVKPSESRKWNELENEFKQQIQSGSGKLLSLCEDFQPLFSSNLRVLLNQVCALHGLVKSYKDKLISIIEGKDTEDKDKFDDRIILPEHFKDVCNNDDKALEKVQKFLLQEEKFMAEFFSKILLINPSIAMERHLFLDRRTEQNAFDSMYISEFWSRTSSLANNGTSPYGFIFKALSHDDNNKTQPQLSRSSTLLVNFLVDYMALRAESAWQTFAAMQIATPERGIALPLNTQVENHPFLAKLESVTLESKFESMLLNLKENTVRQVSNRDITIELRPACLSFPVFLDRTKPASQFIHLAHNKSTDRSIENTFLPRQQIKPPKNPRDAINIENLQGLLSSQREEQKQSDTPRDKNELALRFLSASAEYTYAELNGLVKVLLPQNRKFTRDSIYAIAADGDDPFYWKVADYENVGALIHQLVAGTNGWPLEKPFLMPLEKPFLMPLEKRFLILLYVASLPLAPLLLACNQKKGSVDNNASALLACIRNLLEDVKKKYTDIKLSVHLTTKEPYSLMRNKAHAVEIKDLDKPTAPAFIHIPQRHVPRCNFQEQALRLDTFVKLLIDLQNLSPDASYKDIASEPPALWREFVDAVLNDSAQNPA